MCRDNSGVYPPTPTQTLRSKRDALVRSANWKRLLAALACAAAIALVLFAGVFAVGLVSGDSMHPSFQNRDIILFARPGGRGRHDAVILQADSTRIHKYVKRVVGMPGDTVNIDENGVSINGELLEEPYAAGFTQSGALHYPITLGQGEYFVLGDNRENSRDSRSFGIIKDDQIEGKVIAVLRTGKENGRR